METAELNFTEEQIVKVKEEADTLCSISNNKSPSISINMTMEQDWTTNQTLIIKEELVLTDDSLREFDPRNGTFADQQTLKQETILESDNSAEESTEFDSSDSDDSNECKVCHMKYVSAIGLYRHLATFSNPKYPCHECGTKFSNKRQLLHHISHTHTTSRYLNPARCPVCGQRFRISKHIQSHLWHFHKGWDKKSNKFIFQPMKNDDKKYNNIQQETLRNTTDPLLDEIAREAKLRALYSCKDCYVPLTKITVKPNNTIKVVTKDDGTVGFTHVPNKPYRPLMGMPKMIPCIPETINIPIKTEPYTYDAEFLDESKEPTESEGSAESEETEESDKSEVPVALERSVNSKLPTSSFACKFCDCKFIKKSDLDKHVQMFHTVIQSAICDRIFRNRNVMMKHFRNSHFKQERNNSTCVCGKKLTNYKDLFIHFYQYLKETQTGIVPAIQFATCKPLPRKFSCARCKKGFWLKSCLSYHVNKCFAVKSEKVSSSEPVDEIEDDNLICEVCNVKFLNPERFKLHKQAFNGPATHPCPVCGTKFNGSRRLVGHIRAAHEVSKPIHNCFCSICNQGFTKQLYKLMHVAHTHDKLERKNSGENIGISDLSTIDSDDPEGEDELNYKCKVCNIVFKNRKRFIEHMTYYKKNEIITCTACCQSFEGQYNAHYHNKMVHYSSKIRSMYVYHCEFCQEGFAFETHRSAHIAHVHGNMPKNSIDQNQIDLPESSQSNSFNKPNENVSARRSHIPVSCEICEMKFSFHKDVMEHKRGYQQGGDFKCNKCAKAFQTSEKLRIHFSMNHSVRNKHTGVICRHCGEGFTSRAFWLAHVKHLHNIRQPSEFYFEKNVRYVLEFGYKGFSWIPQNVCMAKGETYNDISNMLDQFSKVFPLSNKVNGNSNNQKQIWMTELQSEDNKIEIPDNHTSRSDILSVRECNKLDGERNWECVNCGIFCNGPAQLAKHFKSCVNIGDYKGGKKFTGLQPYVDDKLKHLQSQAVNRHERPVDQQVFKSTRDIIMHTTLIKPKPLQSCINPEPSQSLISPESSQCDMIDDSTSQVKTEFFEEEPSIVYECPECTEKFSSLHQLLEHTNINHAPRINGSKRKYRESGSTIDAMEDESQTRKRHESLSMPSDSIMTIIRRDSFDKHNYAKTAVEPDSKSSAIKISKPVGLTLPLLSNYKQGAVTSNPIVSPVKSSNVGSSSSLISYNNKAAVASSSNVSPVKFLNYSEGIAKRISKNAGLSPSSISNHTETVAPLDGIESLVRILNPTESTSDNISTHVRVSPSSNSNVDTTDEDPLETDSLLAEKSQVGLLKVRSFANVAQKLNDKSFVKRKRSAVQNSIQNKNSSTKKPKKLFDPIVYAELCKQHNIELP